MEKQRGQSESVSGPAQSRMEIDEAREKIKCGITIKSDSGTTVKFGEILYRHLEQGPDDQRPRFLPAAMMTVQHPVEIWQNHLRRYYIARFVSPDGHLGFVVVATRIGEIADEAITFFPKDEKQLKKFRKGEMIYQKK